MDTKLLSRTLKDNSWPRNLGKRERKKELKEEKKDKREEGREERGLKEEKDLKEEREEKKEEVKEEEEETEPWLIYEPMKLLQICIKSFKTF